MKTEKQLTAVEWLQKKYKQQGTIFNLQFEQAKEMEKQIIAQAFEDGDYNYFYNPENGKEFENGIEYYNQKFKSE